MLDLDTVFEDLQPRRTIYNISIKAGSPLVLQCSHIISIPPATVTWYTAEYGRDRPRQSPVEVNDRIAIDDSGEYQIAIGDSGEYQIAIDDSGKYWKAIDDSGEY